MSTSNTITKADLLNVLNNLPLNQSIPVGHKNLLWTNESPTTAFAAQTISLDLSGYDEVEIYTIQHISRSSYLIPPSRTEIGMSGDLFAITGATGDTSGYCAWTKRTYTTSTSGVTFTLDAVSLDGTAWLAGGGAHLIPYKIYGIKYSSANMSLESLGIHISTVDPTSADGNDGDIWIKYEA